MTNLCGVFTFGVVDGAIGGAVASGLRGGVVEATVVEYCGGR